MGKYIEVDSELDERQKAIRHKTGNAMFYVLFAAVFVNSLFVGFGEPVLTPPADYLAIAFSCLMFTACFLNIRGALSFPYRRGWRSLVFCMLLVLASFAMLFYSIGEYQQLSSIASADYRIDQDMSLTLVICNTWWIMLILTETFQVIKDLLDRRKALEGKSEEMQ